MHLVVGLNSRLTVFLLHLLLLLSFLAFLLLPRTCSPVRTLFCSTGAPAPDMHVREKGDVCVFSGSGEGLGSKFRLWKSGSNGGQQGRGGKEVDSERRRSITGTF